MKETVQALIKTLLEQRAAPVRGGLYWETQIAFAYDSSRIEGSRLSRNQTRSLYETRSVTGKADLDDLIAVNNHFLMFDYMLDTLNEPLTEPLMRRFIGILSDKNAGGLELHTNPGSWKTIPNGVAGIDTTPPHMVPQAIERLLDKYHGRTGAATYETIAAFHVVFERIHPCQDGNGRVGRMIIFRECLKNGLVPPVVTDATKDIYYEALNTAAESLEPLTSYLRTSADKYLESVEHLIPLAYLSLEQRRYGFKDPTQEEPFISRILQESEFNEEL